MPRVKKNFFDRNFPNKRQPNYSTKELIYFLEILPLFRRSAIIKRKRKL